MLDFIFSRLYFFAPAYIANMTPPLAKKLSVFNFLDKPVDFNKKWKGLPILGSHKTWRGVVLGIINGIIAIYFQKWLYQFSFFQQISLLNYQTANILMLGFLISLGTVLGDLISAFFKRRLNLEPGARFMPFDQINYVVGVFVFLNLFSEINLDLFSWLILAFLTFFLHVITNLSGYYLGFHSAKW